MMHPKTTTISEVKQVLSQQLSTVLTDAHERQSEISLMLQHLLNCSQETLLQNPYQPITTTQQETLQHWLIQRVQQRMPLQYILGEAHFYGLSLQVTPSVLIPRPETELLVERAIGFLSPLAQATILDIGTGSGAIILAIAHYFKTRHPEKTFCYLASDLSQSALEVAQANAANLNLESEIRFLQGDLYEALEQEGQECQGSFDLIVSNPPYIHPEDYQVLSAEVKSHEPASALIPPEGKAPEYFYQAIARGAGHYLKPTGAVMVELGHRSLNQAREHFIDAGLSTSDVTPDLNGIARILTAHQPHCA